MKRIFTSCILLLPTLVLAQNPGNVGTANLTAWFRAGDLTPGLSAPSWSSAYPAGTITLTSVNGSGGAPIANGTPTGNVFNYNTVVDFSGNTDANNIGLSYTPATLNLLDNSLSTSQGTMFVVYQIPDPLVTISTSGQHIMQYRESSTSGDGIQLRRLAGLNRMAIGNSNNVNATKDYTETFRPTILSYKGNYLNSMGCYNNNTTIPNATVASSSSGYKGLYLGTRRNQNSGAYEGSFPGYIAEVIFYNTNLTAAQFSKVHSYLAIKYGITLSNGGTALGGNGNYVASDGTTIWDATTSIDYHNDVIGIGADADQGLTQKQSHTSDDSLRIYVGTLATTNANNISTITTDKSFIMAGRNTAKACASGSIEYPIGAGIYSRIDREWKIKNTAFTNAFNMDITLPACASIGNINTNDLVLLADYDDGDFSNASVFNASAGISFSMNGNVLTVSNISNSIIPASSVAYLTIASLSSNTPLPLQFINLTAQQAGKQAAILNFNVNSNSGASYFNVQKSADAKNWSTFSRMNASEGTIDNNMQYFTAGDNNLGTGKTYYRIESGDASNNHRYSSVQTLTVNKATHTYSVYPNPANDMIHINMQSAGQQNINIYDGVMKDVTGSVRMAESDGVTNVDISRLHSGVYIIKAGDQSLVFIKQ